MSILLDLLDFTTVILEAPWLRLYRPIGSVSLALAKLLGRISPHLAMNTTLDKTHICRNEERTKSLETDGCYHNRISFRLITEITEAGEAAIKNAKKIKIPTLLLCPAADKIVCPNAIREFAQNANKNITTIEYPDGYHALRNDSIRDTVLNDIKCFIKS